MRCALVLLAPAFAVLSASAVHCSRSDPPTWDAAGQSPSVAALPASLASLPPSAPVDRLDGASSPVRDAVTKESTAIDPGKLPQTADKPNASGPAFDSRVSALWDAIVSDAPERALPFFFPVDAYAQIKDVPNPAADWNGRLVAAFKRDVRALHARLGANAATATLGKLDVPSERARWVKPHEEMNTGSYWRVFGSRLHYEIDGNDKFFEVASLISWRGEWYVVHLNSIK